MRLNCAYQCDPVRVKVDNDDLTRHGGIGSIGRSCSVTNQKGSTFIFCTFHF